MMGTMTEPESTINGRVQWLLEYAVECMNTTKS
jgi:hypothetical protein